MTHGDTDAQVSTWQGHDLQALLKLRAVGEGTWRTTCVEPNSHGRVFGGQMLAQTVMAAAQGVDEDRLVTVMQMMFLQGADTRQAVNFAVTRLQHGKRFTSFHVRGGQGDRAVCDAHVSFAVPLEALSHEVPIAAVADPTVSLLPEEMPEAWSSAVEAAVGHVFKSKPALEFRLPDPPRGLRLTLPEPRFRFWVRAKSQLPDDSHVHAAVLAYMSDHWFNYASVGGHIDGLRAGEQLYMASLNHALWVHRRVRADEWLLFDIQSPCAGSGRGFVVARVHDRAGHLVASGTQECVMTPRGG